MLPREGSPWESEVHLGTEGARGLIRKTFPKLAKAKVEPLGEGWDNAAFRVGDEYVFRFPRRQIGAECLEHEIHVLPALPALPLPISAPTLIGKPIDGFPWPFAGYPYLPGRPTSIGRIPEGKRVGLATSIARFLSALHAIRAEEAAALGAPPDSIGRVDPSGRVERMEKRLVRLVEAGLVEDPAPIREALRDIVDHAAAPRADALCHGDLGPRHVLTDEDGEATGVVDWGDVHIGDPAVDLSIAWSFGDEARDALFAAYGPVDESRRRLARFRAIDHSVSLAFWAHETDRATTLHDALGTLANAARG
jgi:aminoglycoside phosphotransferase (APT) family kinase protein